MDKKVIHFAAGPCKLPDEVLKKAQDELLDYGGTGVSVMEISHRSTEFKQIITEAEQTLRDVMHIPNNYSVLFLQGGAHGQFAGIPLNLIGLKPGHTADYVVTGAWSSKAATEAEKYAKVNRVLPKFDRYTSVPDQPTWNLNPDASYVYYCANETIHGVEFQIIPDTGDVPLICDMSSNILTRVVDVSKFAMIYAGAQKNMGPAGVTIVIVRDDLIGHAQPSCPIILEYGIMKKNMSLYNTPPCFCIYMVGLVLKWLKESGGVEEMDRRSAAKSALIYDEINASNGFYHCPIDENCRSRVNVPFRVGGAEGNEELEKKFVAEALKQNMTSLAGHRSVGGIRVSLYNAITVDNAQTLATFMKQFRADNS